MFPIPAKYYFWELLVTIATCTVASAEQLGHRGPNLTVFERNDWPRTSVFFNNFGVQSKPVVVRGAGKMSPAFKLWTDEYLMQNAAKDTIVTVEREKKENRKSDRAEGITLLEFLSRYQEEEMYMVHEVPENLKKDIVLPPPLQCHVMQNTFSSSLMWFSSGGTSSVLHIDAVDNINCVLAGTKHVVLIDRKFADKVPIDNPNGNYCGVDVDNVNFEVYPGLLEVEYYHVDLQPGDCIFIPYRWFHQVRSQERNIAVNIWWNHYMMKKKNFDHCPDIAPSEFKTIDKVTFNGNSNTFKEIDIIRDHLLSMTQNWNQPLEYKDFKLLISEPQPDHKIQYLYDKMTKELFLHLDENSDGTIDTDEILSIEESVWKKITETLDALFAELQDYEYMKEKEFESQDVKKKDEL